ncbi:flagellar hook-associated 3 family protein [Methylocella silvestris BL2]|uniref:Flagellin n=1 Tax=Methylocella silvestris (strain DSM 15510 / CIP 108128 / LMG 27833 / NCIMB 13906 / BL2) TaxID=395965 RepID=B8EL32_METSB|nr:flagellar hook-associated family protein [Methylocella silvestris]ACK49027.1 flagellar hook-associated 3 family protein [Methylocella silvestris BL2]
MSSYISTQSISSSLRQSVLKMQAELSSAQTEAATGNHADIGLSLASKTGQSVSLQAQAAMLQTLSETNSIALTRMNMIQNQLGDLQSGAQSLLNSLLSTNGSAQNAATIEASGADNLKGLIASLNSTLNGDYLFAGINTATAPLTDYYATGASSKTAVDAAFSTAFGMSQTSSSVAGISASAMQDFLDGPFAALFQGSNWTNDWSSASDEAIASSISPGGAVISSVSANQSAFRDLAEAYTMLSDLGGEKYSQATYDVLVGKARDLLTDGISALSDAQAGLGVAQSSVSDANTQMSLQMNILSSQIGNLESINGYEVQVRISDLQTQIQTAYSLTSHLQDLSLVKYL